MSEPLPVPRFDPSGPTPGATTERRRRLLVLAGGALVLALVVSSAANASRASLRCVDGQLVPYQGRLLPVGEEPLEDEAYPPLRMPTACEDELFESHDEFEQRYVELAFSQVDPGGPAPPQRLATESAIDAIDAMSELPAGASEQLQQRRRALLEKMVQQKVHEARLSEQEALQWIERARRAGADPAVVRAAERSLGLDARSSAEDEPGPEPSDVVEPEPPLRPAPTEPTPARSL